MIASVKSTELRFPITYKSPRKALLSTGGIVFSNSLLKLAPQPFRWDSFLVGHHSPLFIIPSSFP